LSEPGEDFIRGAVMDGYGMDFYFVLLEIEKRIQIESGMVF
jgi:hypothetical protein